MGVIGKNFKFKKIKNFLTKDEVELANYYFEMSHRTNLDRWGTQINCSNSDTSFYGDKLTESFLLKKKKLIEKKISKKLLPTYSFWRMYTKYSDLKKHIDRPSCEISVSVSVGNDGTKWPIFIDGHEINLEKGDAVIYLGRECPHWREEFLGDWCAQFFLHYVVADGEFKDYYMDKRIYWGTPGVRR